MSNGMQKEPTMKKEKMSALQLFYVLVGFEIGNTVIFGIGADAKQDAWLAIMVGMVFGLVLMFVYTKLSAYYPGDTLVQMIPKIIGKYLAFPINLIYVPLFYLSCFNCLPRFWRINSHNNFS